MTNESVEAAQGRLRVFAFLTSGAVVLTVDGPDGQAAIPPELATGVGGRISIPHVRLSSADAGEAKDAACASASGSEDCAYWTYMVGLRDSCLGEALQAAPLPNLYAFNSALRSIAQRAGASDRRRGSWEIHISVEDDVPVCHFVALTDAARFRDLAFDWTEVAEFRSQHDELVAQGLRNPLVEPTAWPTAQREAFLFPAVVLVRQSSVVRDQ